MDFTKLFNPDYLLHLCKKYGLQPSKKYGQNYLINPEVIEKIIEAANLSKNDTVIEVGPGFGILTFPLLEKAGNVVAFEIEKKLQPYWDEEIQKYRNTEIDKHKKLEVVWGNVLKQASVILNPEGEESERLSVLDPSLTLRMTKKYKLVANLPYQITSAVIRTFLEAEVPPSEMILMVQKEVAERICAKPGDMSLLAVSVQYYADPEYLFTVPRTDFWPSPQVDSAVIRVRNKEIPKYRNKEEDERFFKVVKAGFAQRRKLLMKNLEPVVGKKHKDQLKAAFLELGLLPTVRAQELSVEQWKKLVNVMLNVKP